MEKFKKNRKMEEKMEDKMTVLVVELVNIRKREKDWREERERWRRD